VGENCIIIKKKDRSKSTPQFRLASLNPEYIFHILVYSDISGCVTRLTLQVYGILNANE